MDAHVSRRGLVVATGSLALSGCLGGGLGGDSSDAITDGSSKPPNDTTTRTARQSSGLPTREETLPLQYDVEKLRQHVRSGGPPKDGIPSIDEPRFVVADDGPSWLDDAEIVFGIVRGNDVKAYPQRILVWHEICNDVVDGDPVSVTYCPLTGTAMGFERGETTFGVSGRLLNSNLVMYDRATDSRWPQMLATAIEGPFEGENLREFRLVWTTWRDWRRAYPATRVLSTDTGYVRNYDRDPYGSYDPPSGYYVETHTMFSPLATDDRLRTKDVIVETRDRTTPVAFGLRALRTKGSLTTTVDGQRRLAVFDKRFDTAYLYRPDQDSAVESVTDGEATLSDGSTHPVDDLPFDAHDAYEAMWFAWVGFYPRTKLVGRSR